ncbi:MAG: hypothetical protein ACU843_10170 [Gammaproteobacteria bacterium]
MKAKKLLVVPVLLSFALTGCVGRLTGGGTFSGVDVANPDNVQEVSAQISFQNVAGAICHPTLDENGVIVSGNVPDTVRGSMLYSETSPNNRSFTCTISDEPIDELLANNFYGSGQVIDFEFQGRVTQYTGDWGPSPPAYCGVVVLEGQFPGLTSEKGSTQIAAALLNANADTDHPVYLVQGTLETGNVQYHFANTQGICTSNPNQ